MAGFQLSINGRFWVSTEVFNDLSALFGRFLVLPSGGADTIALWVLYTWSFDLFSVSPILAVTSPTKRCGKTTLVTLLGELTHKALAVANITPAALFRFVEQQAPTLIIDEGDRFLGAKQELTGILNAGHTKATARVIRTVGDDHQPRCFSTWCPKAIAMIGALDDTLFDRAVQIRMRRATEVEKTNVESLRLDRLEDAVAEIRSRIKRWSDDHAEALRLREPQVPGNLHSRAQDNWRPLLAIAEVLGAESNRRALRAIESLAASDGPDEDHSLLLLGDVKDAFRGDAKLATQELIGRLQLDEERPWCEWIPIAAPRELAKLLKPFGIHSKKLRFGDATVQGYVRSDCEDAFRRYLSQAEHLEQQNRTLEVPGD